MPQKTIESPQFGTLTFDQTMESYTGTVGTKHLTSGRITIAADDLDAGIAKVSEFLNWLDANHTAFKLPLEEQIQNYDLVWDDTWDETLGEDWVHAEPGFLEKLISYESIYYRDGKLLLWVDTSGLHTDHMIRATLNESFEIELCEML